MTYNKYVYDAAQLDWVTSFDSATGSFTVSSSSNEYIEEKFLMLLTLTIPDSINDANTIEETFTVWIKHPCADN